MAGWNTGLNEVRFPSICKDCKPPKRQVGCHAGCKEYLDAKAEFNVLADAEREARRAVREAERATFLMRKG